MIYFTGTRISGKSTEAVKLAFSTGSLLVVPTRDVRRFTERFARDIGCPVVVIDAREFFDGDRRVSRDVVIDELDWCIREVTGARLLMATSSGITMSEASVSQEKCLREAQKDREG